MSKLLPDAALAAVLVLGLTSCHSSPRESEAANGTEVQQSISPALEKLYMACGAVPQHSPAQQDLVKQMAERASNGKELLLVMRALVAGFPTDGTPEEQRTERAVRSLVTGKLMKVATFEQLTEYATRYPVNPDDARALVERMFELAEKDADPQTWYRLTRAARGVKVEDLAQQAQTKGDALARR